MKRLLSLLVVLGAAALLAQAQTVYVTPDVPTVIGGGPVTLLPFEVYRYNAGVYTTVLSVPGGPFVDGIHKMDAVGDWLLSVEAPNNLAGLLGLAAEPRDILRYDGALYSFYFCPSQDPGLGIPAGVNLDALYLEGTDTGDLVVSFDIPVELPPGSGTFYAPAHLVRFMRTGGAGCGAGAWVLAGANPVLATIPPMGIDIVGADADATTFVFTLDIPAALTPTTDPSPPFFTRDELVSWDGATHGQYEALAGWPAGSEVHGLSLLASPGRVPPTITLAKAPATDIVISWPASCADGAEDYAIYEGTLGTWYSHTMKDCSSAVPAPLLSEQITPPAGTSTYYLVVPRNDSVEGSYGLCSSGVCLAGDERPNAAMSGGVQCIANQVIVPCP